MALAWMVTVPAHSFCAPHAGEVDGGLAVHARRLRGVAVKLVAGDDAHAVVLPGGVRRRWQAISLRLVRRVCRVWVAHGVRCGESKRTFCSLHQKEFLRVTEQYRFQHPLTTFRRCMPVISCLKSEKNKKLFKLCRFFLHPPRNTATQVLQPGILGLLALGSWVWPLRLAATTGRRKV